MEQHQQAPNVLRNSGVNHSASTRSVWTSDVESNHNLVAAETKSIIFNTQPSRRRLELYLASLLIVLICVSAAFAVLLYLYVWNCDNAQLCTTTKCIKAAANILQSMDESVDPCDHFYNFVCGNWQKDHPIPDTSISLDWYSDRSHVVVRNIRDFLEQNDSSNEPKPVYEARRMYRACKDIDMLEQLSLRPLSDVMERAGLFLSPLGVTGFNWIDSVANVKRLIDKDVILGIGVFGSVQNRTINKITIASPSDDAPIPSHKQYEKKIEKMLKRALTKGDKKGKRAWKTYIIKTIKYIYEYNNQTIARLGNQLEDAAEKIIDFETELSDLISNTTTAGTVEVKPDEMRVNVLQRFTDKAAEEAGLVSKIFWRQFIEKIFKGIHNITLDLDGKDVLAVYDLQYYYELSKLLARTPTATIMLMVWWDMVFTLAPHTTAYMRDIRADLIEKTIGESGLLSRPTHCSYVVWELMSTALGVSVADERFLNTTKKEINKMLDDITNAFVRSIDNSAWIDKKTKTAIKEKAMSVKREIGFPEWLLDKNEVEQYYGELNISEFDHLLNMVRILEGRVNDSLSILREFNYYNSTNFDGLEVNALYDPQANSIVVPVGLLQFPFYELGLEALNYGAIGSVIGHELVHAFDNNGMKFDKNGNMNDWWTNKSVEAFNDKLSCFVDKYSDYYIQDVAESVDGNLTLAENIADNGGLHAAYHGYKIQSRRSDSKLLLPGLQKYTHDQLFFISHASIWCESWTDISLLSDLDGEHSPNFIRVLATLSNSPEFARIWSCPLHSEMNPEKKCDLF